MYDKILVALDHSQATARVLDAATALASLSQGEVWVLHLRERESRGKAAMPTSGEQRVAAEAFVTDAVQTLAQAGVKATPVVRDTLFGYAAREIVREAHEHNVGVIVMGSRGRGDLTGLLLGSTAHKVMHLTDRPVLVVR
jgi:nucleotide-binding universal stress UspA family protein